MRKRQTNGNLVEGKGDVTIFTKPLRRETRGYDPTEHTSRTSSQVETMGEGERMESLRVHIYDNATACPLGVRKEAPFVMKLIMGNTTYFSIGKESLSPSVLSDGKGGPRTGRETRQCGALGANLAFV